MRGYYKRGKFKLLTWKSLISQFVHPVAVGRGWGKEGHYFSQIQVSLFLEYMIIWCNIQVIINPLLGKDIKIPIGHSS